MSVERRFAALEDVLNEFFKKPTSVQVQIELSKGYHPRPRVCVKPSLDLPALSATTPATKLSGFFLV
jgi:hypothetical protein